MFATPSLCLHFFRLRHVIHSFCALLYHGHWYYLFSFSFLPAWSLGYLFFFFFLSAAIKHTFCSFSALRLKERGLDI